MSIIADSITKQKAAQFDNLQNQAIVDSLAAQKADAVIQQDRVNMLNSMRGLRALPVDEATQREYDKLDSLQELNQGVQFPNPDQTYNTNPVGEGLAYSLPSKLKSAGGIRC